MRPRADEDWREQPLALWLRRFDLRPEFEDREHAGHLRQALGLFLLGGSQFAFAALFIQQEVQPVIERLRETQSCQIGRHRDGELNGLTHGGRRLDHRHEGGNGFVWCRVRGASAGLRDRDFGLRGASARGFTAEATRAFADRGDSLVHFPRT